MAPSPRKKKKVSINVNTNLKKLEAIVHNLDDLSDLSEIDEDWSTDEDESHASSHLMNMDEDSVIEQRLSQLFGISCIDIDESERQEAYQSDTLITTSSNLPTTSHAQIHQSTENLNLHTFSTNSSTEATASAPMVAVSAESERQEAYQSDTLITTSSKRTTSLAQIHQSTENLNLHSFSTNSTTEATTVATSKLTASAPIVPVSAEATLFTHGSSSVSLPPFSSIEASANKPPPIKILSSEIVHVPTKSKAKSSERNHQLSDSASVIRSCASTIILKKKTTSSESVTKITSTASSSLDMANTSVKKLSLPPLNFSKSSGTVSPPANSHRSSRKSISESPLQLETSFIQDSTSLMSTMPDLTSAPSSSPNIFINLVSSNMPPISTSNTTNQNSQPAPRSSTKSNSKLQSSSLQPPMLSKKSSKNILPATPSFASKSTVKNATLLKSALTLQPVSSNMPPISTSNTTNQNSQPAPRSSTTKSNSKLQSSSLQPPMLSKKSSKNILPATPSFASKSTVKNATLLKSALTLQPVSSNMSPINTSNTSNQNSQPAPPSSTTSNSKLQSSSVRQLMLSKTSSKNILPATESTALPSALPSLLPDIDINSISSDLSPISTSNTCEQITSNFNPPLSPVRPPILSDTSSGNALPSTLSSTAFNLSISTPSQTSVPDLPTSAPVAPNRRTVPLVQANISRTTPREWKIDQTVQVPPKFDKTIQALSTYTHKAQPIQFFYNFFPESIIETIAEETNRYAIQTNSKNWTDVTPAEIKAYLGILIMMGLNPLPDVNLYWSSDPFYNNPEISKVMPLTRYKKIVENLHLRDNEKAPPKTSPNYDKLYKLRNLIDILNETYQQQTSNSSTQSIDECMVKFKGRSVLKQYMPMKPIKRGFKVWARCDSKTGYLYQFDVYIGKGDSTENEGLSYNVVWKLCQNVPQNTFVAFDNFFTSCNLLEDLYANEIYSVGTVRSNRKDLPDMMKKSDAKTKLKKHDFAALTAGQISAIKWMDTREVTVLTTAHQPKDVTTVKRTQKDGSKKDTLIPSAIADYTLAMGGVDLFDHFRSSYPINRKSRKFWMRLFLYLFDASIINSYITYTTIHSASSHSHRDFRLRLARGLIDGYTSRKRASTSFKNKKGGNFGVPDEIRLLNVGIHLPEKADSYTRCRFCSTKLNDKRSNIKCCTCNVSLYPQGCFKDFHLAAAQT